MTTQINAPSPQRSHRDVRFISCSKWIMRYAIHRGFSRLLRLKAKVLHLPSDAPIVVIAPHADDETLGCGGVIARQRRTGAAVHIIYVSDSGASHPEVPREQMAKRRRSEALTAMQILGVDLAALTFLEAPDGCLNRLSPPERSRCIAGIRHVLDSVKPVAVFAPCAADASSEHEAVFVMLREALAEMACKPPLLEYPIWSWWSPWRLFGTAWRAHSIRRFEFDGQGVRKREALSAYRSQVEPSSPSAAPMLSPRFLRLFSREEEFFFES